MNPNNPTPEQVKANMMFEESLDKNEVSIKVSMREAIILYKILTNTSFTFGDFAGISKLIRKIEPTVNSIKLQAPGSNPSPNHVVEPTILGSRKKN